MRAHSLRITEILLLLTMVWARSFGAESQRVSQFQQANLLYEEGKYSEAITRYEGILKQDNSPAVLFNLGNAYFKNGELGRAIYCYRRAARLSPRDPDIQANLRFARDRISGSASVPEPAWQRLIGYVTLNEVTAVAGVLLWLVLMLLALVRYRPAWRATVRSYTYVAAVLFAVTSLLLVASYVAGRQQVAIAVRNQVVIHLGPLVESQAAFTVADGTELRVENLREGWAQISDRSNRTGWVETDQVLIFPEFGTKQK